uniref:Tyrosine transaminase n=1 Tax=Herpetomonas muscarum TaxID=5718 RepID=T1YRP8_HERMU|nr:tyrosine transaminase [Herpetomonas muscarum]AGU68011.1 tyrosine transaminase [Herpetomonas muscarum]
MPPTGTTSFPPLVASVHAANTLQPLTELTDKLKPSRSNKSLIKLSMGDPTADGNLVAPKALSDAMVEVVQSGDFNGYPPVSGYTESRDIVCQYWSRFCSTDSRKAALKPETTLLTSGGSHAIVLAITAIANPGDNILVPAPAFPHYKTVCDSYGIECRYYPLSPEKNWECDLAACATLRDDKTKGFLIINPSNPCGSNYSRAHVEDIVKFCETAALPLISDEIYAEVIFGEGEVFTSIADFDSPVPRLVLGGTAKHAVTPGWRLGWAILVDTHGVGAEYWKGMDRLAQLMTGSNSITQTAIARALLHTPESHLQHLREQLKAGAKCYDRLLERKDLGITFDKPTASMFVMLQLDFSKFKDIADDMEFYEKLLDEENVQVLPGEIFGVSGFVRATTSRPAEIVNEAVDRIITFAERHVK